jgi:hypothetical protein
MDAPLVVMVNGWLHDDSTSMMLRVTFHSRSIGWYGSVLLPSAIGSHT